MTKNAGIQFEPKSVRHDFFIQRQLKENVSGEQPLGRTSGTEAVGQDPRNRTVEQNGLGQKLKANPWAEHSGLTSEDKALGLEPLGKSLR